MYERLTALALGSGAPEKGRGHGRGVRLRFGVEDDDYVSEPGSIGVYDIGTIFRLDGDILPYLGCPAGTAFEREDERSAFVVSDAHDIASFDERQGSTTDTDNPRPRQP